MPYEANDELVKQHPVPDWFHNAKLGIFIHWGLFSVPGWAPPAGNLPEVIEKEGWEGWFRRNPYAEWYANSLKLDGSPTVQHHHETYGADFAYEDFAPIFNEAIKAWDPTTWAAAFRRTGARYVVLVTKHHDGFLLWPSQHPNPHRDGLHARRHIVGALTQAVRDEGLKMGLYYSGGLDWTINDTPIRDSQTLFFGIPQQQEYVEYANAHWRELIARYEPFVVWNDIGYPRGADVPELFAFYYNIIPDGVINDRFAQRPPQAASTEGEAAPLPPGNHFDFRTPEYASYDQIMPYKWEACRGVGFSFGYNRNEGDEHHRPIAELIRMFVDIVSKNGNLLLNIGPMADGAIPELQMRRLEALGDWLATNGEAIFDTRPWQTAEGTTAEGIGMRFTQKGDTLYALLLGTPPEGRLTIQGLRAAPETTIRLLGAEGAVTWEQQGDDLRVTLPANLPQEPVIALALSPQPALRQGNA